jgi:hypothetical protein
MSTAQTGSPISPSSAATAGVRLHRFTVDEYHRMGECGVFHEDDPIELLGGHLFIKGDNGPRYDVPLGIPPEEIAGPDVPPYPQRRFTVREYHKLLKSGALHPALRTELVEGWVVDKMTRGFRHDSSLQRTAEALQRRLSGSWRVRLQSAIVLDQAEFEPDIEIVAGPVSRFDHAHPRPHEVALAIEISDTTLAYDRGPKRRDYARNGIVRLWIVDLISRTVNVHEDPTGPTAIPDCRIYKAYGSGESIPLMARDDRFDAVSVNELLPAIE